MLCKICAHTTLKIFRKTILARYEIQYFQCPICRFIQTEEPYWLQEAYQHSLNMEDTGIVQRNLLFSKRTSTILFFLFNKKGLYVDWGGGSGLFVRLMRDQGFNFFWNDPYTENIFARGFEYNKANHNSIDVLTTFECFEHFVDPLREIEKLLSMSHTLLFSTVTFAGGTPDPERWDYYSFSHGQHIAFYSLDTLRYIARTFGLNLYTNHKSFHLLTPKNFNNTLYNGLLILSQLGISPIIGMLMGSKMKQDESMAQKKRNTEPASR